MAKFMNPTKVITGPNTTFSYLNCWDAKSINGSTPKFSVSLIIPKSDIATIEKIKVAIQAAYEEGQSKLKGNGKSNRHINTMSLRGVPTCPCCGAQLGVVVCECGNIMCSDGQTTACPWCGMEGSLGEIAEGGMDITRGRG